MWFLYVYLAPVMYYTRLPVLCLMYFVWGLFDLNLTLKRLMWPTLALSFVGLYVWHNILGKHITRSHYCSSVHLFNIAIWIFFFGLWETLRMVSRSNCSYGIKVLVRTITWHIEMNDVVKNHKIISISRSVLIEILGKVNFPL